MEPADGGLVDVCEEALGEQVRSAVGRRTHERIARLVARHHLKMSPKLLAPLSFHFKCTVVSYGPLLEADLLPKADLHYRLTFTTS